MDRLSSRLIGFTVISVLLIVGGCGGTPASRFYVLSPMPSSEDTMRAEMSESCVAISVGPVIMPDYIDRPQIVTRISENRLRLAEFDQWAEPLGDSFPRILMENLSTLLCAEPITLYPSRGPISIDYRVEVEVIRLDGRLGEQASLVARWIILDERETKVLLTRKSNLNAPVQGGDYEALVSAQSQTIAALSRDIAEAIKAILNQKSK